MSISPGLFQRIGHFLQGPNPLHPATWEGRLKPLTIRRTTAADVPQCLEIYRLNEPGRFPEAMIDVYEKFLASKDSYHLVAEREGRIVGTGGMHYIQRRDVAIFCYGMVRPGEQGKSIGTALLLARLSLLHSKLPASLVLISALDSSISFYQRFGFRVKDSWRDKHGKDHPVGKLTILNSEVLECRKLLAAHGIVVPPDEDQIPFRERPEE